MADNTFSNADTMAIDEATLDQHIEVAVQISGLFQEDVDVKISKVEQALKDLETKEKGEIEVRTGALRDLTRHVDNQRALTTRPPKSATAAQHQDKLRTLDERKRALAKAIADLEQDIGTAEAKLENTKAELKEAEDEDVLEEQANSLNSEVLRLKLYRNLGFQPLEGENGIYSKMIVRSDKTKDVRTVPLDNRSTTYFNANYLWDLADA